VLTLQSEREARTLHQAHVTCGSKHQPPHSLYPDDNDL
jgi:hypothetical protein